MRTAFFSALVLFLCASGALGGVDATEPAVSWDADYPSRDTEVLFFDDMEGGEGGWTHTDLTASSRFHTDTYMAYGGTGHSWWCGTFEYDADGGYGNNWDQSLNLPTLDISGCEAPTLSLARRYHTEPGYDYVLVQVYSGGVWVTLNGPGWDGSSLGWAVDEFDLTPFKPSCELRLRFTSDGAYSDEDTWYDSVGGACMFDDIKVYDYDNPETVVFFDDGEPGGDTCTPDAVGSGDYWHIIDRACPAYSGVGSWWCGDDGDTSFVPANLNNALTSPLVDISDMDAGYLFFRLHLEISWEFGYTGFVKVQITTDEGATWIDLGNWYGNSARCDGWVTSGIAGYDLAPYLPASSLQFRLVQVSYASGITPSTAGGAGVMLDDVRIVKVFGGPLTLSVPDVYPTIRSAIDAAVPGDIIEVGDGIYPENVFIGKPNLTLRAGSTPIIDLGKTSPLDPAVGDCITVGSYATGTTIDGFTVRHGDNGIVVFPDDVTIQNCTIYENYGDGSSTWNHGQGIRTESDGGQILNNHIYGNSEMGILATAERLLIQGNHIHDNGGTATSFNSLGLLMTGTRICDVIDNVIHGHTDFSVQRQCGIYDYASGDYGNNVYSGNVVYGNEYSIVFEGAPDHASSAQINSFYGNSKGMINVTIPPAITDAINNWWGDASGPYVEGINPLGTGDTVYGAVEFDPWLGAPPGVLADVYVDDDYYDGGANDGHAWGYDAFATIQEGIDAVGAGTVHVAAGTYPEQVVISSGVDLRGAQYGVDPTGSGSRIDSGAESIVGSATLPKAVDLTDSADGASVSGFTLVSNPTSGTAVIYANNVDNLIVEHNIMDGMDPVRIWDGISLYVHANRITSNGRALHVRTVYGPMQGMVVEGNDIRNRTGASPSSMGIDVPGRADGLVVTGNTISGYSNSYALGGNHLAGAEISNNVITGNRYGIALYGTSTHAVISDNDLSGNSDFGLWLDTSVVMSINASANYWGSTDAATVRGEVSTPGQVDYTPWLAGGTPGDPGYSGDFSTLYVDDDSPQFYISRIQEAAELVDGSTVHVLAGTYPQAVVFDASFNKDGVVFDGDDSSQPELTGGVHFLNTGQIDGITFRDLTFKGVAAGAGGMIDFDNSGAVNDLVIDGCLLDGEMVSGRLGLIGNKLGGALTVTETEMKNVLGWALMDIDSSYAGPPHGGNELPFTTVTFTDNYIHECNGSISLRGNHLDLTDVATISGNTFENIGGNGGEQGQHWAALELNHCDVADIFDNTVDGVSEGEWTEGQAFQLWDIGTLNFENNFVLNCHQGVYFFDGSLGGSYGGPYAIPSGAMEYNTFAGNTQYGVSVGANCTGGPLDAEMNWWNSASGPSGVGPGTGDAVLGNVDYDPWIGKAGTGNIVCDPDVDYLSIADQLTEIDVNYLGGGGGLMYGYTVKVSWDPLLVTTTPTPADVTQGTLLSDLGTTFWNVLSSGASELTITCILLGAVDGTTGPGTMFSIDFDAVVPVGYGVSPVDITIDRIRDKDNNTLTGFFENDGEIIVDTTAPSVTAVYIANDDPDVTDDWVKNGDPVTVTATVTDAHPSFTIADIEADLSGLGGAVDAGPTTYDGTTATWVLGSVTCTPSDGTVTVTVTAVDAHGNTGSGSDTIEADNTPPTEVTAFDASPGHGKCDLTWTNGTDDNLAGVVVRRYAEPGEYPQYPWHVANYPSTAKYPVDESSDDGVYDDTGESFTDDTMTGRNIYYYQAFCYDEARNYGLADAGARDLATNYWLGDISDEWGSWGYDGQVDDEDILKLGLAYWTSNPTIYPGDAECDLGPTVHPDWGRLGLPKPDDEVEFEDAMIFAMNYGVVAPRVVPFMPEHFDPAPLALAIGDSETRGDMLSVALRLEGNSDEVKGLSASLAYDSNELEFVSASLSGNMVSPLGEMFFMHRNDDERVELDAIVLGTGVTIGGSGDVAVVTFRQLSDGYTIEVEEARLRDVDNSALDVKLGEYSSDGETPLTFRLVGNTPNPFNPTTKIAYNVPRESEVTIRVYDVTGRVVATLVDGVCEPGRHQVVWNGKNDAGESVGSGIYFCSMEAPDFHESRKMTLLK